MALLSRCFWFVSWLCVGKFWMTYTNDFPQFQFRPKTCPIFLPQTSYLWQTLRLRSTGTPEPRPWRDLPIARANRSNKYALRSLHVTYLYHSVIWNRQSFVSIFFSRFHINEHVLNYYKSTQGHTPWMSARTTPFPYIKQNLTWCLFL